MLYLTRSPKEAIRIGDEITVVVLKAKGDRVTLGIEAPREVGVGREGAAGPKWTPGAGLHNNV